jgi:hypothetical protein
MRNYKHEYELKKARYEKIYENAPEIECACGCGQMIKSKDHWGREKKYVSGHNGRKYENPTQYKREWNHRNREHRYSYKTSRSHKLKGEYLIKLGGKCSVCDLEYDGTNAAVFDFHHYTGKKSFPITVGTLSTKAAKDIEKELKKCTIICSNCHRLQHSACY